MKTFHHETLLNASAPLVFEYLASSHAFDRLKPPNEPITVLHQTGRIENGSIIHLEIREMWGLAKIPWVLKHQDYIYGEQFCDVQVKGPFISWKHLHRIEKIDENTCKLIDSIQYRLPMGKFTEWMGQHLISWKLKKLFKYREPVMQYDLAQIQEQGGSVMKILVSGSTGLVGSALVSFLSTQGHNVTRLCRGAAKNDSEASVRYWSPTVSNGIHPDDLEGFDAIVHLSGDNIASGRWSESKRKTIYESRVHSTQLLANALSAVKVKPKVFVCASAIGYYGDTGSISADETFPKGHGFLSDTCDAWEKACKEAQMAGIRVVNIRTGLVLSPKGGALQKILPIFSLGGGGQLGNGQQYWSWISIDDLVGAYYHAIINETLKGPVNAVAPEAMTNKLFTKTLGSVLKRSTFFPVPAFILRILLGEMADTLLLESCKVKPAKLQESGYEYRTPELEQALRHLLGR